MQTTETRVDVFIRPPGIGKEELNCIFEQYGTVKSITLQSSSQDEARAYLVFEPSLHEPAAVLKTHKFRHTSPQRQLYEGTIKCSLASRHRPLTPLTMGDIDQSFSIVTLPVRDLHIGNMQDSTTFLAMFSPNILPPYYVMVNDKRKLLEILFDLNPDCNDPTASRQTKYKISFPFTQIRRLHRLMNVDEQSQSVWITLDNPPFLYREIVCFKQGYGRNHGSTNASQTWVRATGVWPSHFVRSGPLTLLDPEILIDVGRWLTYTFVIDINTSPPETLRTFDDLLRMHNILAQTCPPIDILSYTVDQLLHWNDRSSADDTAHLSSLDLNHQLYSAPQLKQATRYRLEVCLSQGILHEHQISPQFMKRLIEMDQSQSLKSFQLSRAARLLEKAAERPGNHLKNAADLFELTPNLSQSPLPKYCSLVHAMTITPSTMYLAIPCPETSNRVTRQFSHLSDRFLRVRFTDERYHGRILSVLENDNRRDELFARIRYVMLNGIRIGDYHYKYLAFGNSQLREHGAYFFASTNTVSVESIRDWMGDFTHIPVVAKNASRLGLCLSTTRAMSLSVQLQKIDDIERNGYIFSDGVGKISPFLAQMIAQEMRLPNPMTDYPSVYQFRLGGCKGVLAVDPTLNRNIVQIRPSQEKFAARYYGLEVCRVSQFATAYLNVQVILALSTLGVPDAVLVRKMEELLQSLERAMTDPKTAVTILLANIDYNRTTVVLARMVQSGFMTSQEPFLQSCLNLWRSWMVKHLKEKARIFIEKGAFVLGCLDEYGILKGHVNHLAASSTPSGDSAHLPEIYLKIRPGGQSDNLYKVITGTCLLIRNPCLHPGDVRVVRAVDIPQLGHLKDCVVLPQQGDRDLASMCSGGDLDGDDFLVMWDEDILPQQWNAEPMNYEAPTPVKSEGPVTAEDSISFFLEYMMKDNLGRIAVAHRYWADLEDKGIESSKCLQLAQQHSTAVDFAKSGVAADMPRSLMVERWPHWAEPHNKPSFKVYTSRKILGQLYDVVQRVPFEPSAVHHFNAKISNAFGLDDKTLQSARVLKGEYDRALRQAMALYGIKTEFEAWTTFALEHQIDGSTYKFAEKFGGVIDALKDRFICACYDKAGTTRQDSDWTRMAPFIAAMYRVTAEEAETWDPHAVSDEGSDGDDENLISLTSSKNAPFISFPWLFPDELAEIAAEGPRSPATRTQAECITQVPQHEATDVLLRADDRASRKIGDLQLAGRAVHEGDLLDLYQQDDSSPTIPVLSFTQMKGQDGSTTCEFSSAVRESSPDEHLVMKGIGHDDYEHASRASNDETSTEDHTIYMPTLFSDTSMKVLDEHIMTLQQAVAVQESFDSLQDGTDRRVLDEDQLMNKMSVEHALKRDYDHVSYAHAVTLAVDKSICSGSPMTLPITGLDTGAVIELAKPKESVFQALDALDALFD